MSIKIPEQLHSQLQDKDDIREVSVPRPKIKIKPGVPPVLAGTINTLPSQVGSDLSAEKVKECWKQAKKKGGDKYAVQAEALRLIELAARRKVERNQTEKEAVELMRKKVAKTVSKKKRIPKTVASKTTRPTQKSKAVKRPQRQLAPVVVNDFEEQENDIDVTEVTLTVGDSVVSTSVHNYLESPEAVVLIIQDTECTDLLHLRVKPGGIGTLEIDGESLVSRRVLATPIRFSYDDCIFIVFYAVPDGL